jgi:hypothetical protein
VATVDHVGHGDLAFEHRDRGERHRVGVRSITGSPHRRVGRALQMRFDGDAAVGVRHTGVVEAEGAELRDTSGAVHDEVGIDVRFALGGVEPDPVARCELLDAHGRGSGSDVDADGGAPGDEQIDEVRVEAPQRTLATVEDRDRGASAGGDVGELEGDEPAADEHDARWERLEVQELGAVDHQLGAGEPEGSGAGAGGDQHVVHLVEGAGDVDRRRRGERGGTVEGVDTVRGEFAFCVAGRRVGEAAGVAHEIGPVDRQPVRVDALVTHQVGGVDDLGAPTQDLLRVTAAKRTRAAVWQLVDDRSPPARRGRLVRRRDPSHASADDEQVIANVHRLNTSLSESSGGAPSTSSPLR